MNRGLIGPYWYLVVYAQHHAQLLLDTAPYNGHLTVIEALWYTLPPKKLKKMGAILAEPGGV